MTEPVIPVITRREQIGAARRQYRRAGQVRGRLLGTAIAAGGYLAAVWMVMITTGIAHRDWWHLLPAMSFGAAAALTFWPFTAVAVTVTVTVAVLRRTP